MSDDRLAAPGLAGLPDKAEYDAVYATVAGTERGRRFLTEYAARSRQAEFATLASTLDRIEQAVAGFPDSRPDRAIDPLDDTAERLSDIAFQLRERGADASLCDALDAAVHDIAARGTSGDGARPAQNGAAPAASASEIDRLLADVASAFAASFEFADEAAAEAVAGSADVAVVGGAVVDGERAPSTPNADRAGANKRPHWAIEAPDFVFAGSRARAGDPDESLPKEFANGPSAVSEPEQADFDVVDLSDTGHNGGAFHNSSILLAEPDFIPARGAQAAISTAALPELAHPMLQRESDIVHPLPRGAATDPLAALRAMSEEELLALFG